MDAAATIEVLSVAMDSPDAEFRNSAEEAAFDPGTSLSFPGGPYDVLPSSSTPSMNSREFSSSSAMAGQRASGRVQDGKPGGGGVWGRRLGRGRARAIAWNSSRTSETQDMAHGDGVGVVLGEPLEWRNSSVNLTSGAKKKDECPSRRSIIEVRHFGGFAGGG